MTQHPTQTAAARWQMMRRACIGIALGSVAVIALVSIFGIVVGDWSDAASRIITSCGILIVWSLLTLLNFMVVERGPWAVPALAVNVLLAATAAIWLYLVWIEWYQGDESAIKWSVTLFFVCMMSTILLQLRLLETRHAFMRIAMAGSAVLLIASTVFSTAMVWEILPLFDNQTFLGFSRFSSMFFFPLLLMTFVGLLAVPVSARLLERRTVQRAESIPLHLHLRMTCPKCAAEQEFRMGPVRCKACRTAFIIDVEEPRCECGYLLYQLRGDVCPECGRAVPDNLKWLSGFRSSPG